MTKKSTSLGTPIERYGQSRLFILVIFAVFIAFGSFFAFMFIRDPEQSMVENIMQTGLIVVFPALVIAMLIWFTIERSFPRKTILLYSDGMRFVSKNGTKSYGWKDIPNIEMLITKDKHTDDVIQYSYTFRSATGKQVFKVDSGSYPGLEKKLTAVLKKAHVQGTVNLDTRVERIDSSG